VRLFRNAAKPNISRDTLSNSQVIPPSSYFLFFGFLSCCAARYFCSDDTQMRLASKAASIR
jgi:hypothetical protein